MTNREAETRICQFVAMLTTEQYEFVREALLIAVAALRVTDTEPRKDPQ